MTMPQQYTGTDVPQVRRFPHTPFKNNTTTTSSSSTRTSSTTTVQNCQELETDPMIRNRCEQLRMQYADAIGDDMPRAILKQLLRSLLSGTPWQYYEYALEEAALAPSPSWRYVMAIVHRLTASAVPVDRIREPKPARRRDKYPDYPGATVEQQCYSQREYTHNDDALDAMMAKWMAEQEAGTQA